MSLTSIATILFTANIILVSAQQGEIQVESEGDLEATLNGESFRTGDTITVSGTTEDPDIESSVSIEIIDPGSEVVVRAFPEITADDTFTFSFVAGEEDGIEIREPMVRSGNYRVVVTYFERTGDLDIYEVEFDFAYAVIEQPPSPPPSLQPQEPGTGGTAGGAATGITPQEGALLPLPSTLFQSDVDGIRIGVPGGWVVEDLNNTDPGSQQDEQSYGAGVLVELCPQNQATPQIGGTYLCPDIEEGLDSVSVWRFADLKSRPEFAGVVQQNQSITTTDLVAFYFMFLEQKANFTNFRLLQDVDTTVDVIDPQTNETLATSPAKYIETAYLDASGTPNERDIALLVLGNDGNTGYALLPVASVQPPEGQLPAEHQIAFDSFELIAVNNTNTNATSIGTSPLSPSQQQLQQQESQQSVPSPPPQLPQLQQEQQPQRLGEEQPSPTIEEGQPLTLAVDRPSYSTGDTITIKGTVAEREPASNVLVRVTDPQGNRDWLESVTVTADNIYQVQIEAGEPQYSFSEDIMDTSGTYLVTASYTTPEPDREVVRAETTFEFTAAGGQSDSSDSSTGDGNTEDTTNDDESTLGPITEPFEDLFG